jgi:hypothetical protein
VQPVGPARFERPGRGVLIDGRSGKGVNVALGHDGIRVIACRSDAGASRYALLCLSMNAIQSEECEQNDDYGVTKNPQSQSAKRYAF